MLPGRGSTGNAGSSNPNGFYFFLSLVVHVYGHCLAFRPGVARLGNWNRGKKTLSFTGQKSSEAHYFRVNGCSTCTHYNPLYYAINPAWVLLLQHGKRKKFVHGTGCHFLWGFANDILPTRNHHRTAKFNEDSHWKNIQHRSARKFILKFSDWLWTRKIYQNYFGSMYLFYPFHRYIFSGFSRRYVDASHMLNVLFTQRCHADCMCW